MTREHDARPGLLLREVRAAVGLTQAEVGRRAGVSQSMVSAYEAGRRQPTVPVLSRLLEAMGRELTLQAEPLPSSLARLQGPVGRRVRRHRAELVDLATRGGAQGLRVFGRTARGEDRPGDRADLLIDADGLAMVRVLVLSAELAEVLGAPVNLVTRGQLSGRELAVIEPELLAL